MYRAAVHSSCSCRVQRPESMDQGPRSEKSNCDLQIPIICSGVLPKISTKFGRYEQSKRDFGHSSSISSVLVPSSAMNKPWLPIWVFKKWCGYVACLWHVTVAASITYWKGYLRFRSPTFCSCSFRKLFLDLSTKEEVGSSD